MYVAVLYVAKNRFHEVSLDSYSQRAENPKYRTYAQNIDIDLSGLIRQNKTWYYRRYGILGPRLVFRTAHQTNWRPFVTAAHSLRNSPYRKALPRTLSVISRCNASTEYSSCSAVYSTFHRILNDNECNI
jgi:hypothetical protein